jgi:hypothetical protein
MIVHVYSYLPSFPSEDIPRFLPFNISLATYNHFLHPKCWSICVTSSFSSPLFAPYSCLKAEARSSKVPVRFQRKILRY